MGATAVYALDTEKDKDAQAIFERSQKMQEVSWRGGVKNNQTTCPTGQCVQHGVSGVPRILFWNLTRN